MSRALTLLALCATTALGGLTATATARPVEASAPATDDVRAIVHAAAIRHGISPAFLGCIASRESTWRPFVTSPGGAHRGLFQWSQRTFAWIAPMLGYPPDWALAYDPWVSSDMAAFLLSRPDLGGARHWSTAWACGWRG